MRIYLIGFMGSGKSALGRQLSDLLKTGFLDLDEMFEERYHVSIYEFFGKYGEDNFRKMERGLILETEGFDNIVISTGGGTPCFYDNMDFIETHGISVYLRMTSSQLAGRLRHLRKKRPLLNDVKPDQLEDWIIAQLQLREKYYLRATHIFHPFTDAVEDLVLKLK